MLRSSSSYRWGFFQVFLVAAVGLFGAPQVHQGHIDLSRWDFQKESLVRLDGEWEFWWDREVTTPEGPQSPGHGFITLPGYWNNGAESRYPAEGSATYHVQIVLPAAEAPWSLAMPDVACAWRMVVNGTVLAENGRASPATGEYRAHVRPRVVDLPTGTRQFDLYLYVVNASDRVGGVRDSIMLGPTLVVDRQANLTTLDSSFFSGGLLVMALFNIVIFFLQRQKGANLWLAVFSTFIAIRTLFTGPRIIFELWPSLTFELSARIEFLCIFGAAASFTLYWKYLFPDWWPARLFIAFLFYTALFAILAFLLPVPLFASAVIGFYDLPLAMIGFVFIGISWWATQKKHEDGPLVFLGMLFLIGGTINDLLYQFVPLPQGYVLGRFLFVFLVFNTILLSRQLSKDYALTQRQSGELRKLDKLKDDFLARVTHELRTPLHGMIGILDAFKMGDFGTLSSRQSYHLGLLEASSQRLLSMVSSILDFSHLKKHQQTPDPQPIHWKSTIDFLLPSLTPLVKPGVEVVNRVGELFPAVLGDEGKLEQVLDHVVRNALQHTTSGSVVFEAEVRDQQALLLIKDTGPGIPREKMDQLFSPFHQVDDIDTRPAGGLGLGLAISRPLMQQMGGRLDLHSQERVGTTVQIWLPLCPPHKAHHLQTRRRDRGLIEPATAAQSFVQALPEPESAFPEPNASASTILIVDDEPVNLMVLKTFLSKIGYQILEATNGPQALEMVSSRIVDLMILDIMMPGMSGYQVCTKIRERFTAARLPVLLLTAKNQVEDLLQGFRCGASDFLTKPFQRDELKARIDLHLQVSKTARAGTVVTNGV